MLQRTIIGLVAALGCCSVAGCSSLRSAVSHSAAESRRLVDQARQAEQDGQFDRAERLLNRALRKNPEDVEAHRQLADVLIAKGQAPAAVDHLRYAVLQNPQDIDGRMRLARLFFERQQDEEANALLDAVLRLDPRHVAALHLKASIARRQGRDDQALQAYYRILRADPSNSEASLAIAAIYLNHSKPDRATAMLRTVCQNPQADAQKRAEAWWSLGNAYGQQHRWTDAAQALTRAVETGTRRMSPDDWYRLAFARFQAGDLAGSREALGAALELQPRHEAAQILASRVGRDTPRQPTSADRVARPESANGLVEALGKRPRSSLRLGRALESVIAAGHTAAAVRTPSGWKKAH